MTKTPMIVESIDDALRVFSANYDIEQKAIIESTPVLKPQIILDFEKSRGNMFSDISVRDCRGAYITLLGFGLHKDNSIRTSGRQKVYLLNNVLEEIMRNEMADAIRPGSYSFKIKSANLFKNKYGYMEVHGLELDKEVSGFEYTPPKK